MNNVILIGRLTKDPQLSFSKGKGTAIARLTVAVNRMQKGEADFINSTAFGKTAETIGNYMTKGSQIAINGELRVDNYKKDDGTWVNNTSVIINLFPSFLYEKYLSHSFNCDCLEQPVLTSSLR